MTLFAGEAGGQEGLYQLVGEFQSDDACAQAEDVHVVMFHALMRRVSVVAHAGADANHFIGGNGGAYAAAADEDAALAAARLQGFTDGAGVVRIIVRLRGVVRSQVEGLVAQRAHLRENRIHQRHTRVVSGDGNAHGSKGLGGSGHALILIPARSLATA